ncbi:MAG: DUF1460 domain-containing protein [Alphaproteobacteria bacterium]|nr:DUF1460 domain-containing protein [Alphaproteobacteria bacterium]
MRRALPIFVLCLGACAIGHTQNYDADIGAEYLGAKYVRDALGEGTAPDSDPLIRFDAFDCTTFVETVLADGNVDTLNKIRYRDGAVSFINRNHFIETEWLPNNASMLENVSAEYGNVLYRDVTINRAAWLKRVHNITVPASMRHARIAYIPYSAIDNINNDVPLIVLFIVGKSDLSDKIGTDLAVVHMGFLMPGGRILRHASSSAGRVVDSDMREYINMRRNMQNNIGISLVKIK